MDKQKGRGTDNNGKKRKIWPVLSILLVLCYLVVFAWYLINGFGGNSDPDEAAGATPAADTLPPAPADPSPEPAVTDSAGGAGDDAEPVIVLPPAPKVRGLYVTAWYAGINDKMDHYFEICETTEINTLVIDVKDDLGQITFVTDTEGISETSVNIIPGLEWIVSSLKARGVYTIARVVCFKDPVWSARRPDLAIHNAWGEPWKDGSGNTWLDPYNTAAWDYIAAVCIEAARIGFDEVQLDYVRFPSDGNIGTIDYGPEGASKSKAEIVSEFVSYIRGVLAGEGVRLSADVFGIIAISDIDAGDIGQDMDLLLNSADCLSPMIYPSHFANKRQNGTGQIINDVLFEAPDLDPYGVVYNILQGVKSHLGESGGQAIIRPYLQDFTASYLGDGYYQTYTAQQVREQIQAVYDAGFDEWIIWNHSGVYNEDAFDLKSP